MQEQKIIMEDINLYFIDLDNQIINFLEMANKPTNQITKNGIIYKFFPNIKIHNHVNIIDIFISSARISPNIRKCYIKAYLYIIHDHETIVTILKLRPEFCKINGNGTFQLRKLDKEQFLTYLKSQKNLVKFAIFKAQRYQYNQKCEKQS